MVRLNCSGVMFGSQLDEKHLFSWALEIPCVLRWEQDQLVVRSRRVSKADLRDLIALLWRYNVPMQQLVQFRNSTNEVWFTAPGTYWHQQVFGQQPNLSFKADGRDRQKWGDICQSQLARHHQACKGCDRSESPLFGYRRSSRPSAVVRTSRMFSDLRNRCSA